MTPEAEIRREAEAHDERYCNLLDDLNGKSEDLARLRDAGNKLAEAAEASIKCCDGRACSFCEATEAALAEWRKTR